MVAGSLIGIYDSWSRLAASCNASYSLKYLKELSLTFRIDSISAFFLILIFGISMASAIYSFHYMNKKEQGLQTSVNYLFFTLLTVSMALVVTASDMISFMLSWELMSISSFFLVIFNYRSSDNRRAGYLYLIFSHAGAMFILTAFGIIYAVTGDMNFIRVADSFPESYKIVAFILFLIGFGSKAGVFPFHVWLPHAHPAAPSHISALMSGVMIKTGIYGIIRIYMILNCQSGLPGTLMIAAGVISGILGVVYAIGQHDIKRLLAYSSVENIGIILIGLGTGMIGVSAGNQAMAVLGFTGGFLHIMNHAIFKPLLFMGAGEVIHKTGSGSIDALGGLLKSMKITGTTFLMGSLAISGLPPFNGFVSEFFIYMAGFRGVSMDRGTISMVSFAIVGLAVIGGLALACFTKVTGVVFQGEPRTEAAENSNEKGISMLVPMVVLALLCLLIGLFPEVPVLMTLKALAPLDLPHIMAGHGTAPHMLYDSLYRTGAVSGAMSAIAGKISGAALIFLSIVLAVFMLRRLLYVNKDITEAGTWGCGFTKPTVKMQYTGTSYAASIVEFFRPFTPLHEDHTPIKGRMAGKSRYKSHISDISELNMERVAVKPVQFLFERLHWIQHGDIHLYIGYIFLAIVALMFFV